MITKELFLKVCPNAKGIADGVIKDFNELSVAYNIDTPKRIAAFIAQCAHESAQFRYTEEIASGAAYEGRKDLGNTQKGDGKRFKGRGYIQITGRNNYIDMGVRIKRQPNFFIDNPALLSKSPYAMQSAMVFWYDHNLNHYADIQYFETMTKRINGGLNGFKDRIRYYNILCKEYGLPLYSYEKRDIIK